MTQPLNVSRKFRQFVADHAFEEDEKKHVDIVAGLCKHGTHFLLPPGGVLLVDIDLRALDTNDELRLPYPITILEFLANDGVKNRRVMIVCVESPDLGRITFFTWSFDGTFWNWRTPAYLERRGALEELGTKGRGVNIKEWGDFMGEKTTEGQSKNTIQIALQFMNAMACSNVHSEILKGREKSAKHCKDALPFDDYRLLTVGNEREQSTGNGNGGSHRSPREHLRRGHIVRPEGRRPFWRNATVVNAGVGGKVHKDYSVAA